MRLSSHDKKDYLVFRHGNLVFKFMHVSRRIVDGHIVAQQTPASRQRSSVHPPPTGPEPRALVNGPSRPAPGATSGRTLVVGSSSPAPSRTHARRRRVQFASSDVVRHGPPNAALATESSSAMHPGSPGLNVTRVSLKEEASARREILELRKETNYASKHVKAADSQLQMVKSEARPPLRPFPPPLVPSRRRRSAPALPRATLTLLPPHSPRLFAETQDEGFPRREGARV